MFVLQECPICYDEYHVGRRPHIIKCGHVFCRPCLDAIASNSPRCPACRLPFASWDIQRIEGVQFENWAERNDRTSGRENMTEREKTIWKHLKLGIQTENHDFRRWLVQDYPAESLRWDNNISEHACVALDVMRKLVEVEHTNLQKTKQLDNAATLGAQLKKDMELIEDRTRRLREKLPAEHTDMLPLHGSGPSDDSGPHHTSVDWPPSLASQELSSRVWEVVGAVLATIRFIAFQQEDMRESDIDPLSNQSHTRRDNANYKSQNSQHDHRLLDILPILLHLTDKPMSKEIYEAFTDVIKRPKCGTTRPQVALASRNYQAQTVHELSVVAGQPLRILLGSDEHPGREWILCEREHELGRIGYVRKEHLCIIDT